MLSLAGVADWSNLLLAHDAAAKGKRGRAEVAQFDSFSADWLLDIQSRLLAGEWQSGGYRSFVLQQPKRRLISAAPFADRVVHHAVCQVMEPWFERRFIADSFANRVGKGNHRAVRRAQQFSRRFPYVLQLDIRQHFASIDHQILMRELACAPLDQGLLALCEHILNGGAAVHADAQLPGFRGDDLLSSLRPRGLPVGNLTSQFWSNVYLNRFDLFIKRELRCRAYVRYVDDMLFFSDR